MKLKAWWTVLVDRRPLRRFFWKPGGVIAHPLEWLPAQSNAGAGIGRFRQLQPAQDSAANHICYFAELSRAKIVGDVSLVATRDDLVLGDLQGLHGSADPAGQWIIKRRRFRRPKKLPGKALLLAAAPGANYFHWIFESVPRWHLAELAGIDLKSVDWILVNQLSTDFHHDSMDKLGIPREKRYRCSKSELLEVESLLLPSAPALAGACPAWVCDFLRRKFLPPKATAARRRIYITRRHARGRRLVGEEEHDGWLLERGFEIVCLEQLRFSEQVELFASAQAVVGVHGAGMSNLVFAPAGCRVLELFPAAYLQSCYRDLAATMKLDYHQVVGDLVRERVKAADLANVFLTPAKFRRQVEAVTFGLDPPAVAPVS
jgi:capsular polysaccharide biosynthesis protein